MTSMQRLRRKEKCDVLNICFDCSKPRGNNNKLCDNCMERDRQRSKKRQAKQRLKHRIQGNCLTCGKPPVPGTNTCIECNRRATDSTLRRYRLNKGNGVCPFCGEKTDNKFRCKECHKKHLKRGVSRWHRQRLIVLQHYDGVCKCCGENTYEFLEIDHINNNGAKHRKEVGSHMMEWIIKNNFPPYLQLLCANCNRGRAKFRTCPHHQEPQQPKSKKARRLRRRRLECIEQYGGKCTCCGEDNWAFLEFDHINNDGKQHRKEAGVSNMPRWLTRNSFPDSIQLLCSNCNKAKGLYRKTPPGQAERGLLVD